MAEGYIDEEMAYFGVTWHFFPITLQIDKEWIKQWLLSDEYKEFLETWCGSMHDTDSEYKGNLGKCNGCSVGGVVEIK